MLESLDVDLAGKIITIAFYIAIGVTVYWVKRNDKRVDALERGAEELERKHDLDMQKFILRCGDVHGREGRRFDDVITDVVTKGDLNALSISVNANIKNVSDSVNESVSALRDDVRALSGSVLALASQRGQNV